MKIPNLLNADIFPIPIGDRYEKEQEDIFLIYSPFTDNATLVEKDFVQEMEEYLKGENETGFEGVAEMVESLLDYENRKKCSPRLNSPDEYKRVAVLPNNICNFSCSYCYSANGRNGKEIDKDVLQSAMDQFVNPNRISADSFLSLSYLGGGEPLLSWDLVQFGIEYTNELAGRFGFPKLSYSVVTNGSVLNDNILETFKKYNVAVSVSFEILEQIQKLQRGNFEKVSQNIKQLINNGIHPQLRSTITKENVNLMRGMVDEVLQVYPGTRELMMEFVTDEESFEGTEDIRAFFETYRKNFIEAHEYGASRGLLVDASVLRNFTLLIERFCPGEFTITPEGEISMCSRICSPKDPGYCDSIYGKVIPNKGFVVNQEKFEKLSDDNVYKHEKCENCFAKWHCGGGCMAQKYVYSEEVLNEICDFTRNFTKDMIAKRIEQEFEKENGIPIREALANMQDG